jgi:(p)ppGpp synthase/HD superfamily hydrolase
MDYMIEHAVMFAAKRHKGQTDKSGEPYILHPLRVMMAVRETMQHQGFNAHNPEYQYVIAGAVLHDVVEDTDTTLDEIEYKFGRKCRLVVDALTRRDGETYRDFIERVTVSYDAMLVKREDIRDNMDPRRVTEKHSLYSRYAKALYRLNFGQWPS